MTCSHKPSAEMTTEELRAEVDRLNIVVREVWFRVAYSGSLTPTGWIEEALEGSTTLTDKGQDDLANAFKLPPHVRQAHQNGYGPH